MEKAFKKIIKEEYPFLCTNKLLIAVSGGVDSIVLAHLCKMSKMEFSIAHCNFNLRGEESDADEAFVKELAEKMEVPFFTQSFNTLKFAENAGISIQMAARELRYNWFEELSNSMEFDYTLTAHHANDNLETFLINLIRGTGPEGLQGIKDKHHQLIRPLINFSRSEIEEFAKTENLKWREDSSNASDKYMRNRIRHHMVPLMQELNPQLLESFAKTQQHLNESMELVEDYMSLLYPKIISRDVFGYALDIAFLKKVPNSKQVLYQLLKSFGFTEWNDVHDLMDAQTGKMVLSDTHRLIKDRNRLLLTEIQDESINKEYQLEKGEEFVMIPEFGTLHLTEVEKFDKSATNSIFVPIRKLKFPLLIRKWKEGDFFVPFGMKGNKKLSDYFKDEKFSLPQKEQSWLLFSGEDLVWIINQRADNRFSVEKGDREILKISFS
ncbi:tRNA(Ile)-lysidine synthase [Gramella sp. Hel_I_59]|uniref:tRNA lysidine(34) synthetase TilS n=1 Tax=Gramella sp. Hel_I_59 TaxID=1249978 RepID=UPI00114E77D2|nr:tRNA lysidine(34) synthetase TilS [Gramella sp. Hel_I_59]TQI70296.1 tRNA(Ile)-lysidine synthase [Gramella sp. Hel_I_59]